MLRLATRGSTLARWQAAYVAGRLRDLHPDLEVDLVVVDTSADRRQDVPIAALGGQGVFVKEVQAAVLDGRADAAVHSAKDLPSSPGPGLHLAAFPQRADPRDALVGAPLERLPLGATIATGSARRQAQLAGLRPDLQFVSLRGNIASRLQKVPVGGAVVVAAAALDRLGLSDRASQLFAPDVLVPQVAQAALAVECRAGDAPTAGLLATIDDPAVRTCVEAERAFLACLGGGCDLPVAAYATIEGAAGPPSSSSDLLEWSQVNIDGFLGTLDGRTGLRSRRQGPVADAAAVGERLARHLLDDLGGTDLLARAAGRTEP